MIQPPPQMTDEVLDRAREMDPDAVETVLTASYPAVYRMAHALTGDESQGKRLTREILRRSLNVIPDWRPGVVPENWFYHHTVISARDHVKIPPDPAKDPLVTHGYSEDPKYIAFVRAIRRLPYQQAESFLLHHGEKLNSRLLGVAMDCSTGAAATHLDAATQALTVVTDGPVDPYATALARAYARLGPPEGSEHPAVHGHVRRALRPRRMRRLMLAVTWLVLLGAAAFTAWAFRHDLRAIVDRYRSDAAPTAQPPTSQPASSE